MTRQRVDLSGKFSGGPAPRGGGSSSKSKVMIAIAAVLLVATAVIFAYQFGVVGGTRPKPGQPVGRGGTVETRPEDQQERDPPGARSVQPGK